jgi:hypothetical protein
MSYLERREKVARLVQVLADYPEELTRAVRAADNYRSTLSSGDYEALWVAAEDLLLEHDIQVGR